MIQQQRFNLLLGVSGSIAAYKAAQLARDLMRAGGEVRAVMTPSAVQFLPALTLENLTRYPVAVGMFDAAVQSGGSWHIHLARWCDVMLIAPCSAATLGKLANGICDTALTTLALAVPPASLLVAPAMDTEMWTHPATQRNVDILRSYGVRIIPPAHGDLASGFTGEGRLPELSALVEVVLSVIGETTVQHNPEQHPANEPQQHSREQAQVQEPQTPPEQQPAPEEEVRRAVERPDETLQDAIDARKFDVELEFEALKSGKTLNTWKGKTVVITAGPTYEKIDDVRFIGNYSSGKMGFALAEQAAQLGAKVQLISGPVALATPHGVERTNVESAQQMYDAVMPHADTADVFILAAAVADYAPAKKHDGKIKKSDTGETMTIELQQTPDILAALGRARRSGQVLVGFALESEQVQEYGREKLQRKNCDMIVANAAGKPDSGFGGDNNTISIITKDGSMRSFPPMSKHECAREILGAVERFFAT